MSTSKPETELMFLEQQARWQYRTLGHKGHWTQCHAQDVNKSKLISRELLYGEEEVIKWAKAYNGKANLFIGRNPRNAAGNVSEVLSTTIDLDPIRDKGTAATDELHRLALEAGAGLKSMSGLLCSSGNGALVIFPFDKAVVPSDTFERQLQLFEIQVRELIDKDTKYGGKVNVDSTYDFPRLVKLLGSISTKGDRRLWRYAKLLSPMAGAVPTGAKTIRERITSLEIPSTHVSARDGQGVDSKGVGQESWSQADRLKLAETSIKRLKRERVDDYGDWIRVGCALREFGDAGYRIWTDWSRQSSKFDESVCRDKWDSFAPQPEFTVGALFHWAESDSPRPPVITKVSDTGFWEASKSVSAIPELWTPQNRINSQAGNEAGEAISTGYNWLDKRLSGGYKSGAVYVVHGVTNSGKSTFLVQTARHCCELGKRVLFVATEATASEIEERYLANGTGISGSQISSGSVSEQHGHKLADYKSQFEASHKLGIYYATSPDTNLLERYVQDFNPDIVIWDYYQHFHTADNMRYNQLAEYARWFESAAIKYQVPFLVGSQLHLRVDFKSNKKLTSNMTHVKDCPVINDSAKVVMVIDWDTASQSAQEQVVVNFRLEKNKGPQGEMLLKLDRSIPRFSEES